MKDYQNFLREKRQTIMASGFDASADGINAKLFKFQRDIVRWALHLGKASIFADTGMGKTAMQLEWAKHVANYTGGKVLILAPLAVGFQTVAEGAKFGIVAPQVRNQEQVDGHSIVVTNYERLHLIDPDAFAGVVLDESSILKAYTGKTKQQIISAFKNTPYKLACTATPAPNDHMELGNHSDFLDIMPRDEMLTRWFIHDSANTQEWRLKKHGAKDFWRWLTSWAVCISQPGDLGPEYAIPDFVLPELNLIEHLLPAADETIERAQSNGRLMPDTNPSSTTLHKVKRESLTDRVHKTLEIVNAIDDAEPVIIWCDTNYEADALRDAFPDAVEVRGSDSPNSKEDKLRAFSTGEVRMIITKPDIAGFGLNWQHCHEMVYAGIGFSFEKLYQSLKRTHRYGQEKDVNAHLIYAETEGNVRVVLQEKREAFSLMQAEMNNAMREFGLFREDARKALTKTDREIASGDNWTLHLGDCVEAMTELADNSVHMSVYSPPFSNLYIYSDKEADMGNSANDDEFMEHYRYMVRELYRITKDGRLSCVHCIDMPNFKGKDGEVSLRDFPGEIIRLHQDEGWVYHSRITVWKNPVVEMQRTKAHGLLHKTFTSDTTNCRVGSPDYILVFRKYKFADAEPVKQDRQVGDYVGTEPPTSAEIAPQSASRTEQTNYSIAVWQRYASPVWFDIDQTNVLNYKVARANDDERHLAPLQLDVIERCVDMWTNPGEVVFTPFAGIGSELVGALRLKRQAIGIELKPEYFEWAIKNCKEEEAKQAQPTLFDLMAEAAGSDKDNSQG